MTDDLFQLFENAGVALPNENSLGNKIIPDDDHEKLLNFWTWFGDSKMVDKRGRPLVLYHGSKHKFTSLIFGRLSILHLPFIKIAAGKIATAAFLAPFIDTVP